MSTNPTDHRISRDDYDNPYLTDRGRAYLDWHFQHQSEYYESSNRWTALLQILYVVGILAAVVLGCWAVSVLAAGLSSTIRFLLGAPIGLAGYALGRMGWRAIWG